MIVETHALTKNYGRLAALEDCSFAVQSGEVFGLLGPNGSGKTTLLRILMGFLRPTRGRATIDNRDCYHDSVTLHGTVSYLPGDVRLARGMRGRDVLAFFARLRGRHQPVSSIELAERLGLELSRKVAHMSTGMRQKLALAAVLAVDVPLLILDEPTSNLDPSVRSTVLSLIGEARAAGRTVLLSSHVLSEIERIADRVVFLRRGRLVHEQIMAEIRHRHLIRARLTAAMPPVPEQLSGQLTLSRGSDSTVTIDAPGDLSPLLGWLARLPLAEVHIEPLGLQAVYERFHPPEAVA